jgi:exosome complex exonuclease RRP6
MSNSIDRLLLNTDTHDEFLKSLMSSLVLSTKTSNGLPKGLDYSYNNSFESYKQTNQSASDQISLLLESILGFVRPDLPSLSAEVSDPYFYEQIVETIDALLDNADIVLNGSATATASTSAQQMFSSLSKQSLLLNKERIIQENVKTMDKPQNAFLLDLDNSREQPFVPRILEKFHKKVTYENKPRDIADLVVDNEQERERLTFSVYYPQPYEYELQTLSYPPFLLNDLATLKPQFPDPLRPFQFVDKVAQLQSLIRDLKFASEIAIDLEHHSVRTFQGLTCLMQVRLSPAKKVFNFLSISSLSLFFSLSSLSLSLLLMRFFFS